MEQTRRQKSSVNNLILGIALASSCFFDPNLPALVSTLDLDLSGRARVVLRELGRSSNRKETLAAVRSCACAAGFNDPGSQNLQLIVASNRLRTLLPTDQ